MPRANRHYIPGYIWHITHRCHKKEFLLKFARDRRRYLQWLFEARKRYGLSVLNYAVTSNHIHLLVRDNGDRDVIPKSIQLIAGRTGRNSIRGRTGKGPTGKTVIMRRRWKQIDIWFNASFTLISTWFVLGCKAPVRVGI